MMLQKDKPEDYVIATGRQNSVRDFLIWSANTLGIDIEFKALEFQRLVWLAQ